MELKIEKLVYGGDGLSRLPADENGPGKTVFVPFSIDGEEVDAAIIEQKPGFARARIAHVVKPSPDRVEPGCKYFLRCGGCHYQHATYERQLRAKVAILVETLKRSAKIELACDLRIHASPEWNYRNRTRVKVQAAPEFAIGYYRFRSHELLPVEQCPIRSPLINNAIQALWAAGRKGALPKEIREIELFADHADRSLLTEVFWDVAGDDSKVHLTAQTLAESLPAAGITVFTASTRDLSPPKKLATFGASDFLYQTKFSQYRVSTGSFFQANRFMLDQLVSIVTSGASGSLALDLYAGVGLFSVILGRSFAQVIAVESSQTAHSDLRHNAPQEVKAVLATTEQYLGQAHGIRPDLVVADPPRGGLGENVVRALAKLESPRITYVSCDPSTLARDLRMLLGFGYKIEQAHLIDLFPQIYHIESVFYLAR